MALSIGPAEGTQTTLLNDLSQLDTIIAQKRAAVIKDELGEKKALDLSPSCAPWRQDGNLSSSQAVQVQPSPSLRSSTIVFAGSFGTLESPHSDHDGTISHLGSGDEENTETGQQDPVIPADHLGHAGLGPQRRRRRRRRRRRQQQQQQQQQHTPFPTLLSQTPSVMAHTGTGTNEMLYHVGMVSPTQYPATIEEEMETLVSLGNNSTSRPSPEKECLDIRP